MRLPDKLYEALRWIVWIVLPSTATLLSTLNATWGWNLPIEAILYTFSAVETFLGIVLGLAKYSNDNLVKINNATKKSKK